MALLFLGSNNQKKAFKNDTTTISNNSNNNYPTLSSLVQKNAAVDNDTTVVERLDAEEIDENFFYKHIITHFHSLFCDSAVVCIPHSKSIQGLVITKDIIGKQIC
jgi:hypothetical protein